MGGGGGGGQFGVVCDLKPVGLSENMAKGYLFPTHVK